MLVSLNRINYFHDGIIGSMVVNDVKFHTLEHSYEVNDAIGVSYVPKIPKGQYTCKRGIHQLKGHLNSFETFEVTGVENHSHLLFHVGNFNQDSEGCVLVGKGLVLDPLQITSSKLAFSEFMKLMDGLESFEIVIT